jgi:hypothetical protein
MGLTRGGRALAVAVAFAMLPAAAACQTGGADLPGPGGTASLARLGETWGMAQPLRGFAALPGGGRDINPFAGLSCASPGNCSAGGFYYNLDATGRPPTYAFVFGQVRGAWSRVRLVPGVAALQKNPGSDIGTPSCVAPGYCSAAGSLQSPKRGIGPVFVTSQLHGVWQRARPLPGLAALDSGGLGVLRALSCSAPGDCRAVGYFTVRGGLYSSEHRFAFVASQVHGIWSRARPLAGISVWSAGALAPLETVSCTAPGDCTAGGEVGGQNGVLHPVVVSEVGGNWKAPQRVRGVPVSAFVADVSCASPGNCAAVLNTQGKQLYLASQLHGRWRAAQPVPGLAALNRYGDAQFGSVPCGFCGAGSLACASPGNCVAGGYYAVASAPAGYTHPSAAFVVAEVNGVWGKARQIPGTAVLNTGRDAGVDAVSCARRGPCTVAGYYTTSQGGSHAYFVSEADGRWSPVQPLRPDTALGAGSSRIASLSCPPAGRCSAVGYYLRAKVESLFVVSQN